MNVKEVLRNGGLAGLLKAAGLGDVQSAVALAQACDNDLGKFWQECPAPHYMCVLASKMGVDSHTVLAAAYLAVRNLIAELGEAGPPRTLELLDLVGECLENPEATGLSERLHERSVEVFKETKASIHDVGGTPVAELHVTDWESALLASVVSLSVYAKFLACPCGSPHDLEVALSLTQALRGCTHARLLYGLKVGRIPKETPFEAAGEWATGWTANSIREAIPIELLTAPRMIDIPGVNPEGQVVWNKRPRGQA